MNSFINKKDLLQVITKPLSKRVDQSLVEKCITDLWRNTTPCRKTGQHFVMMFPPPNITGNLHLGHALTATIQDALIRQRKMTGRQVMWIPGFDHAGLATQIVVEGFIWRQSRQTRQQLGKDKLRSIANEWKNQKRCEMRNQLNRIGLMLNQDSEYFTLDKNSSLAVRAAFKQLFDEGIIYRSVKEVYWSNQLSTTLSDIEVDTVEDKTIYMRTGEQVYRRPVAQWFVNAKEMAQKAVDAVDEGLINIIPPNYKRSWSSWLVENGVEDWCISRQGWWGHRIPAFKLSSSPDVTESWVIADDADEACRKLQSCEVVQDEDVLDTWFSSSLLPLTISGWPHEDLFIRSCETGHYPLSLMETGFDILTHWVSKMVMMSLALTNTVPFKTVLLHGMICDSHGKKMSKSKGNVIDPLDLIEGASLNDLVVRTKNMCDEGLIESNDLEQVLQNQEQLFPNGIPKCGADGLRAYLLSQDIQEEVIRIQVVQIEKVRRLANKMWNVYRLILSILDSSHESVGQFLESRVTMLDKGRLDDQDLELLTKQAQCVNRAHQAFELSYQLQHCFNELENFWSVHFSNNYLVKNRARFDNQGLNNVDNVSKLAIALECLVTSTKLMYPYMPHLSEFLYQKLFLTLNKGTPVTLEQIKLLECQTFPDLEEWNKFL